MGKSAYSQLEEAALPVRVLSRLQDHEDVNWVEATSDAEYEKGKAQRKTESESRFWAI